MEKYSSLVENMSGWATKFEGISLAMTDMKREAANAYTLKEPLGVVGCITPW